MTDQRSPDLHPIPLATSTSLTDLRGLRHPPIVKELAQIAWFDAGGNCVEAARIVAEKCTQDPTGDYPKDARFHPSPSAIRRWSKNEGWRDAFAAGAARDFPSTLLHLHSRLAEMGDPALDTIAELMRPGYAPSKEEKIKLDAAKHVTVLLGLGTAGARGGQPTVTVQEPVHDDTDGLTPIQRAHRNRNRLIDRKAAMKKQRRS